MAIVLYHHPFSRAANVVWMLEELAVPYELKFVDLLAGAQKSPEILALNAMGKLPILTDGAALVTESAAIGLYLADRYAPGTLAPLPDDPARGTYLRWSFFSPSVIEPGLLAKMQGWTYKEGSAGWGAYDTMLEAMEGALANGPYVLGDKFSMADMIFGGTIGYMLSFGMLEPRPVFKAYADRLAARPARLRADAINTRSCEEHGIRLPT